MRGAVLVLLVVVCGAVGAGAWWFQRSHATNEGQRLRAELALAVERGALADLGRAQGIGRRLVVADAHDREAAAALAFTSAVLAVDYGIEAGHELEELLSRAEASGDTDPFDPAMAMLAAARALALLRAGDRARAERVASAAAAAAPGDPTPLYALGRARALSGDLPGAARAFEAAIVGAPGFSAARVAWAEAQLDLGDARTARATLAPLVAGTPQDFRARALLDEAEVALGQAAAEPPGGACPSGRWPPPAVTAACQLAWAGRARRAGARDEARTRAASAAQQAPDEPRLLARTALALAQLGAVDRAAALLTRARRYAAPEAPWLAWARAAVTLGRGAAGASLPEGRSSDPEARLLVARGALAAGGAGAVVPALGEDRDLAPDADLRALIAAGSSADAGSPAPAGDDPVRAYVAGLRAQLAGDPARAADRFAHALAGHGDACRAAGELNATTRTLKRRVDPVLLAPLRAENAGCVNLASIRP